MPLNMHRHFETLPDSFLPQPLDNIEDVLAEKLKQKLPVSSLELVQSALSVISRWYFGSLENLKEWQAAQDDTLRREILEEAIRNCAMVLGATEEELAESALTDQDLEESLLHIQWQVTHYRGLLLDYLKGNLTSLTLFAQLESQTWDRRAGLIQEMNARDGRFDLHDDEDYFWRARYWQCVSEASLQMAAGLLN